MNPKTVKAMYEYSTHLLVMLVDECADEIEREESLRKELEDCFMDHASLVKLMTSTHKETLSKVFQLGVHTATHEILRREIEKKKE